MHTSEGHNRLASRSATAYHRNRLEDGVLEEAKQLESTICAEGSTYGSLVWSGQTCMR